MGKLWIRERQPSALLLLLLLILCIHVSLHIAAALALLSTLCTLH